MYSVYLLDDNGKGSYLSVKGKTEWKTLSTAKKHYTNIREALDNGLNIWNTVYCWIENDSGIEVFPNKYGK